MKTQTPIRVYINCSQKFFEDEIVIEKMIKEKGWEVDYGLRHYESTVHIIPELSNSADKADFALFLLDRHDGNLFFEYGYFFSRLGIGRVALIVNPEFMRWGGINENLAPTMFKIDIKKKLEGKFEREKVEEFINQYDNALHNRFGQIFKQSLDEKLYDEIINEILTLAKDEIEKYSDEDNSEIIPVNQKWTTIFSPILNLIQEKGKKILSEKPKVFISYNHQDYETADKVKSYLEDKGIQVTIDKGTIGASEDITKFIYRCIRDNDVIISIVSTRSLQSAWVGQESINSLLAENVDDKYFIACRIDNDYTGNKFLIGEIKRLKDLIQTKESEREELAKLDVDTAYIDTEI